MLTEVIEGLSVDLKKLLYVEYEVHGDIAKFGLDGRYTHLETKAGKGTEFIGALKLLGIIE